MTSKNSKKVLLCTSPLMTNKDDLKKSAWNSGLLYLGSALANQGHQVKVVDTTFEGWDNVRSTTENTIEYGLSDSQIVQRVSQFQPDIIGINLLATVDYGAFLSMIKCLKAQFPKIPLVAGGAHLTALPEKALRDADGSLDYIVRGEGEIVFTYLVENLDQPLKIGSLPGLAYLSDGRFVSNPRAEVMVNLDSIGDLRLELMEHIPFTPEPTYAGSAFGRKYLDLFLSRGCPLECIFCCSPQMWQQKLRTHSLEWVSRQLDQIKAAGYQQVLVQDDNFSRFRGPEFNDWAYRVMDLFKEKRFYWENNGGLEMENLTPDLIDYMAKTNCTTLFIPLNPRDESGRIRPKTLEHYKKILGSARNKGIFVYSSHVVGFPDQTIEGMEELAQFAKKLRDGDYSNYHVVYAASILPGTKLWHQHMQPTSLGEWEVKPDSPVQFEGGWENWPLYSINSPQFVCKEWNLKHRKFKEKYYTWIRTINGQAAETWFSSGQWPK